MTERRYEARTTRGYGLNEVVSAMQKAIRRGDERLAGYFTIELFESGFEQYAWRRLLTISAEDCARIITQEVKALTAPSWCGRSEAPSGSSSRKPRSFWREGRSRVMPTT